MKQEDIFQIMYKYATLGILLVKSDGEILKANPFAEKLFGFETGELKGQGVEILVPDALRFGHTQYRDSYHKKPVEREMCAGLNLYARYKDGKTFPVEISLGYIEMEEEILVITYISDISSRKKSEAALEKEKETAQMYLDIAQQKQIQLNAELEKKVADRTKELKESEATLKKALEREQELNVLKSRFVSMASHEFRTPLSSILSSSELLEMYIESGRLEKSGKNIARIKNSVRNLTGILNDFLSLEKLESSEIKLQTSKINLSDFLKELHEEIKPILRPQQQLILKNAIQNTNSDRPLFTKKYINQLNLQCH